MHESVFFFKQKTAYEIMPSLVGSEMCIRDRSRRERLPRRAGPGREGSRDRPRGPARPMMTRDVPPTHRGNLIPGLALKMKSNPQSSGCLLYTSDAADDLLCVDLGGRRI